MAPNALPFVVSWLVLACVVLALGVYKAILYARAGKQEFPPHIFDMSRDQAARIDVATHLEEAVEKWGKILTVVTVAYGLALFGVCVYQAWATAPGF
jgi:hypothetical protein